MTSTHHSSKSTHIQAVSYLLLGISVIPSIPTALANTEAPAAQATDTMITSVTIDETPVSQYVETTSTETIRLAPQANNIQNNLQSSIQSNIQSGEQNDVQSVALQTYIDPKSGMVIDDTYALDVPSLLSLDQAQRVLTQVSPKMAANNAAIAASELRAEATESLKQPMVFLNASATHYDINHDVSLSQLKSGIHDGINQGINNLGLGTLPPSIDPSSIITNHIPDNYEFHREGNNTRAGVAVVWPVYTAGRTDAITGFVDARTQEAQADALLDGNTLYTTLVQRYFNAQLAIIAAYLRDDALRTIQETDHMAQRLLDEGFISTVERLEAKSALAEAQSEAIKARNDARLAMTALQSLLRTPTPIKPTTPLFVYTRPLPELAYFQDLALKNHPGLKKVDAKYQQASQIRAFSDTGFKPTINIFGYHEIDKNPSWVAGVSANWKLWGGLNKSAQLAAGDASLRQAQLSKLDVSDNILLLVEKNWQAVDNARVRFLSLGSNEQLTAEVLRLKQLGLQEGVNTAIDVAQAQTKYLKARTERAAAANDYVQALANLMESCGTPLAFNDYMNQADVRLPQLY
ncbi:TolC family protein [Psychrobacter sp. I-STPA6b]|uniref:TolC family protein n=1 Tax=Psychrobacter sp. I-STPA6b TaxID=2585718 RepID=UPI001D0CA1EB|nr:TolC family protein [Psychrobacter sp. I-STPA6b]